jgi:hypothetical protein
MGSLGLGKLEEVVNEPAGAKGGFNIPGFGGAVVSTEHRGELWEMTGSAGVDFTAYGEPFSTGVSGKAEALGKPGAFRFVKVAVSGFIGRRGNKGMVPVMTAEFSAVRGSRGEGGGHH